MIFIVTEIGNDDFMLRSNEFKDFESYRSKDGNNSPFGSVK